MRTEETNLLAIVKAWNPAVAAQLGNCFVMRDSAQNNLATRHSDLTTTIMSLLVDAKAQFEKRPAATLDRIDRCLKVLSK